MEEVLVLIVRRSGDEIEPIRMDGVRKCFPGKTVRFERTDPVDFIEHDRNVRGRKATLVWLADEPLIALAMRHTPHVTVLPDGSVRKVTDFKVEHEPFTGSAN